MPDLDFRGKVFARSQKSTAVRTIATTWLVVGSLDILSAIVIWLSRGVALIHGFQGIASGLLGAKSYQGGLATAALGLAIHFCIALVVVTSFYLASRKLRFLTKRPFVSGVAYGIGVYLVMYWIVLPAAFSTFRHRLANEFIELAIHICLIGLPTAFIVRRYSEGTD
ncbi:MAG TPA: hypothetical protein VFQ78_01650 [Candidatus Udaeobacter sp.]|jgi:ABC-type amino acid transport system permease subunit|nr:hypothetical protein [Candidatus Udaeobacter sp.]